MTITTLTIDSVTYTSYATLIQANERLAVDPVREATWELLSDEDKNINLVAATNRLDYLNWRGEKTGGDSQENKWARTGVTYIKSGGAVSTTEVPLEVEDATALLAGSIAISAKVSQSQSSASNIKRAKAGSAEVEFFRAQKGKPLQDETAFALVSQFLEGATVSGPFVSGTGCSSSFSDIDKWGRVEGFP